MSNQLHVVVEVVPQVAAKWTAGALVGPRGTVIFQDRQWTSDRSTCHAIAHQEMLYLVHLTTQEVDHADYHLT
jgi:hypothetical protein